MSFTVANVKKAIAQTTPAFCIFSRRKISGQQSIVIAMPHIEENLKQKLLIYVSEEEDSRFYSTFYLSKVAQYVFWSEHIQVVTVLLTSIIDQKYSPKTGLFYIP